MENKKKIAWISAPGQISTDRFIVPEVSKHYDIEWFVVAKETEAVDFENELMEMSRQGEIKCEICRHKERNFEPGIISWWKTFSKQLKNGKYDLVYEAMIGMPFFMPVFHHYLQDHKTLIAIHNVRVPKGGTYFLLNKLYVKYTISHFEWFHTFSKDQMDELLSIAPQKHCDHAPFVIMDYGKPRKVKEKNEIVFLNFGFIREYKRVDVLIDAAQNAYERTGKHFKVIIAGICDDWSIYQKRIKYDDLFDLRIRRIDDSDVPDLFAEADYFVAPYQDIAQSGSAIIAINYNMPVIASRLPAFEEYIIDKETGYLFKPADVDALTEIMLKVIDNHSENYRRLSDNVKNHKMNFTAEKVAEAYIRNFEDVLNDNQRKR